MRTYGSKKLRLIFTALVALTLGACGSVSKNISADGRSAGELKWPAPHSYTPTHKGGTFPDVAELRLIHPGMNKHQISELIGFPHYSEGVVGVREWNYLFSFRAPDSDAVVECQYKVLFDSHKLASSFYWLPASCADRLNPDLAQVKLAPAKEQSEVLSADALFSFDKYSERDIKPNGKDKLDELARKIVDVGDSVKSVRIAGYSDRLGSALHNRVLSAKRAQTVKHYLAEKGVLASILSADGYGADDPIVQCSEQARAALIKCLSPNRRVAVTVTRD